MSSLLMYNLIFGCNELHKQFLRKFKDSKKVMFSLLAQNTDRGLLYTDPYLLRQEGKGI